MPPAPGTRLRETTSSTRVAVAERKKRAPPLCVALLPTYTLFSLMSVASVTRTAPPMAARLYCSVFSRIVSVVFATAATAPPRSALESLSTQSVTFGSPAE